jgi:hypothetical protein
VWAEEIEPRAVEGWESHVRWQLPRWRALTRWGGRIVNPTYWAVEIIGAPAPLPRWRAVDGWALGVVAPEFAKFALLRTIRPGGSAVADFSALGGHVMAVEVAIRAGAPPVQAGAAWVSVEEYNVGETEGLPREARPYRWFAVSLGGISPGAVERVGVVIRVEKSWLMRLGIGTDEVAVYGWDGRWVRFDTKRTGEDPVYWYYHCWTGPLAKFVTVGWKSEAIEVPALLPAVPRVEVPPPPLEAVGALVGVGVAFALWAYLSSWPVRVQLLERRMVRVFAGARYERAREVLGALGRRIGKGERLRLARLARELYPIPVPKIVPVTRRMAPIERVAVERLERFIRERRMRRPAVERRRLAQLRRRLTEEEVLTLRRLERFISERRRAAPAVARARRRRKGIR